MLFQHLGDSATLVNQLVEGSHKFSKKLADAKKPLIILGAEQLDRCDGAILHSQVQLLARQLTAKIVSTFWNS